MKHLTKTLTLILVMLMILGWSSELSAQESSSPAFENYFEPATTKSAKPDEKGFIRRWLLLEPISKPNRNNRVFTDSYVRDALTHEYFPNQFTVIPKDGEKVKVRMETQAPVNLQAGRPSAGQSQEPTMEDAILSWHALDSKLFNVKLFRFATGLDKTRYGVIFWAVTIVECDQDIENVRLAVGTNKGSMWWVNGEELLLLSGDRHMNVDSAVSKRITLKKGRNIVCAGIINGPSMSDFCARFIDEQGNPVTNLTIKCK